MILVGEPLALIDDEFAFAPGAAEIEDRPVLPAVKAWLSREQQGWIEKFVPERITLPRGRAVKVAYSADGPPTVAARIAWRADSRSGRKTVWIESRGH